MACPYAKYIKGTIAYCTLLDKKVSTLRYPCKGNYRRCPIYVRRAGRAPRPRQEQAARREAEAQAREAPSRASQQAPAPAPAPRPAPAAAAPGEVRPSEALCDSLVLASLIAGSRALATYRGPLSGLLAEASRHVGEGGFLFIVGRVAGYQVRLLYAGKTATYAFEKDLQPVCGDDARGLWERLRGENVDAVIYSVEWERVPLWREQIARELGVS